MDAFAEAYLRGTGDVELPAVLPQVGEISSVHERYDQATNALRTYTDEHKRSRDILEKHKAEFERMKPLLLDTEARNMAAIKRYDESVRALSPSRLFPYDLVMLDLR